ncbi:MAG: hypothetical protein A2284_01830 [Deltaproteobacteria bacterium RIFOXYA12_FULL_61_11]|nr:MAG: hypothetical protein A2284_01830 [Deltaproteobacteria bacterium RIFOXYA12_FULL_61_11]
MSTLVTILTTAALVGTLVGCNKNLTSTGTTGNAFQQAGVPGATQAAGASGQRKLAFVSNFQSNTVSVVSFSAKTTSMGMMPTQQGATGMPTDLGLLDNSTTTVSATRHSTLELTTGANPSDLLVTTDKKVLIVANAGEDSLSVIPIDSIVKAVEAGTTTANGKTVATPAPTPATVETGAEPMRLVQTGDGKYVFSANRAGRSISIFKYEGGALTHLRDVEVQYSPNDVDLIEVSNLLIVSSFIDGGFTVFKLDRLVAGSEEVEPLFVQQYAQVSALAVAERTKNILTANTSVVNVYPQGVESLIRNASVMPIPQDGANSDVMFDRSGKLAVITNQTTNTATLIRFNSNIAMPTGFQEEYQNLNFEPMTPVSVGTMPVRVWVDPAGKYAITVNSGSRDISFLSMNYARGLQALNRVQVGEFPSSIAVY